MIRVYFDTCCLNRPLDDQRQERVRLESEAIIVILGHIANGEWALIGSGALDDEIAAISDPERRKRVRKIAGLATSHVRLDVRRRRRGEELQAMGIPGYDSLHLACAEAASADVLLTTDDALARRAHRLRQDLRVAVTNPRTWLQEMRA